MPVEITMPRLSDTMEEGILIKWVVEVGDKVEAGDVLADIETDKATMEFQSFDDGVVAQIVAEEGEALPVGALIAVIAEEGENVDAAAASGSAGQAVSADDVAGVQAETAAPVATVAEQPQPTISGAQLRVSPVARKIAQQQGVDLATLTGTGPGGRVIKRDVLAAAPTSSPAVEPQPVQAPPAAAAAPPAGATTVALSNRRKTIARRLVESKTTIPHFTVTVTIDSDRLLDVRSSVNSVLQEQGVKLSVNDFVVKACALALIKHPQVNASWADDAIAQHATASIGVAVALPQDKGGGLVVPTIRDAQHKSLQQISGETRALGDKARQQGLTIEEMADATFTVSNLGMLGVDHFEAIINPPQAAILAVGAALEKPVVREGQLTIGREMTCTMSCDHRVVDGAVAAEFLQTLKTLLENPAALLV